MQTEVILEQILRERHYNSLIIISLVKKKKNEVSPSVPLNSCSEKCGDFTEKTFTLLK